MRIAGTFTIHLDDAAAFEIGSTYEPNGSYTWNCADDLIDYIRARRGHWCGHEINARAMLHLAESLRRRGIKFSANEREGGITYLQCGATLCDFHNAFPFPMEVVRGLSQAAPEISDARALFDGVLCLAEFAAARRIDLRGSLGSTAWRSAVAEISVPKCTLDYGAWDFGHRAYLGGRLAIVRPYVRGGGSHFDLVNAYPSALRQPMPTGAHYRLGARRAATALAYDVAGIYRATVTIPDGLFFPPLPFRYGAERVAFPTGTITGVWVYPELAAAVALGATIDAVHEALVWDRCEPIFDRLMDRWFKLRRAAGKKSPYGQWLSRMMKALAGTFARGMDHERVVVNPSDDEIKWCPHEWPCSRMSCTRRCGAWRPLDVIGAIWSRPFRYFPESGHVQYAAYLTAYTRLAWLEQASRIGADVVYGNTDSLWITGRVLPAPRGAALGQWEYEHAWKDFTCRAPNRYAYTDDDGRRMYVGGEPPTLKKFKAAAGAAGTRRARINAAAREHRLAEINDDYYLARSCSDGWYGDRLLDARSGVTYPASIKQLMERTGGKAG